MFTNHLVKERLRHLIQGNLDLLCQHLTGTVTHQWACCILLMQFIEYLLKYKIQSYSNGFPKTHDLKTLYEMLTADDRSCIEEHFSRLMAHKKQKDSESFDTIEVFVDRYYNSYTFLRYPVLQENFRTDEEYFYVVDTFIVLIALMECSDIDFNLSGAYSVLKTRIKLERVLKQGVVHSKT